MGIIFDYLDQVAYDSIYDTPFNELDLLMLTEITYLPFDQIVSDQMSLDCSCRLFEAAEKVPQDLSMLVTKNRLKLLEKVASSTRFKNIKLMGYVNDIDSVFPHIFQEIIHLAIGLKGWYFSIYTLICLTLLALKFAK